MKIRAGKRIDAFCPSCRRWIDPGDYIQTAPGRGRVWAHVDCQDRQGRAAAARRRARRSSSQGATR